MKLLSLFGSFLELQFKFILFVFEIFNLGIKLFLFLGNIDGHVEIRLIHGGIIKMFVELFFVDIYVWIYFLKFCLDVFRLHL